MRSKRDGDGHAAEAYCLLSLSLIFWRERERVPPRENQNAIDAHAHVLLYSTIQPAPSLSPGCGPRSSRRLNFRCSPRLSLSAPLQYRSLTLAHDDDGSGQPPTKHSFSRPSAFPFDVFSIVPLKHVTDPRPFRPPQKCSLLVPELRPPSRNTHSLGLTLRFLRPCQAPSHGEFRRAA